MSYDVNNSGDVSKLIDLIRWSTKHIYFLKEDSKLKVVSKEKFESLNKEQKMEVFRGLENVIKEAKNTGKHGEINEIQTLRNKILHSIPVDSGVKLSDVPNDVFRQRILGNTSPKDVANLATVSKAWKKGSTHQAKILSINNGRLRLRDILPYSIRKTSEAIEWLKKDPAACRILEYADFKGFDDFNEGHLEELCVFPNLKHLFINSFMIKELRALPEGLQTLHCGYCPIVVLPEKLPEGLQTLYCDSCHHLTALPQSLPKGLQVLDCTDCPNLTTPPKMLPKGLQTLFCDRCPIKNKLMNMWRKK